jgi:hypothetical protein
MLISEKKYKLFGAHFVHRLCNAKKKMKNRRVKVVAKVAQVKKSREVEVLVKTMMKMKNHHHKAVMKKSTDKLVIYFNLYKYIYIC